MSDYMTECRCCNGFGTQKNKATGITEICKCCEGTGKWRFDAKSSVKKGEGKDEGKVLEE